MFVDRKSLDNVNKKCVKTMCDLRSCHEIAFKARVCIFPDSEINSAPSPNLSALPLFLKMQIMS